MLTLTTMANFGEQLQARRTELGLTMQDLADAVGISRSGVSRIESGDRGVSRDLVERLAKAVHWDVSQALAAAGYAALEDGGGEIRRFANPDDVRMVDALHGLPESLQDSIRQMVFNIVAETEKNNPSVRRHGQRSDENENPTRLAESEDAASGD